MQKYLPTIKLIAAIIARMNPTPLLDAIEAEYGRTVRLIVIVVVVIVAVSLLGYNLDGVLAWVGGSVAME